jgi:hypothetical protein
MCECVRECVWAGVTAVGGAIDWNQGEEQGGREGGSTPCSTKITEGRRVENHMTSGIRCVELCSTCVKYVGQQFCVHYRSELRNPLRRNRAFGY